MQHMGSLGNSTEQAYLRTDQLEHRLDVLEEWSEYVVSGEVKAREDVIAKKQMDKVVDSDGRTKREILEWSREMDEPLRDWSRMTAGEAAKWAKED